MELSYLKTSMTEDGKFKGRIEFLADSIIELSQLFSVIASAGQTFPESFSQNWAGYDQKPETPEVPEEPGTPAPDTTHAGLPCWHNKPDWDAGEGKVWLNIVGVGWIAADKAVVDQIPDTSLIAHWRADSDLTKIIYSSKPTWEPLNGYVWGQVLGGWVMLKSV